MKGHDIQLDVHTGQLVAIEEEEKLTSQTFSGKEVTESSPVAPADPVSSFLTGTSMALPLHQFPSAPAAKAGCLSIAVRTENGLHLCAMNMATED